MHVLVAYASRHGATRGIAERIADRLSSHGVVAEAREVSSARGLPSYDAFVIGSAAYMYHWLKEAADFARRNRALLATRPVWIFSSGPIGTDMVDKAGQDVLVTSEPKEWPELNASLRPRGARIFFGAFDPSAPAIGLAERFMQHMPASARNAMPAGDFRDWPLIEAWADEIATRLGSPAGTTH